MNHKKVRELLNAITNEILDALNNKPTLSKNEFNKYRKTAVHFLTLSEVIDYKLYGRSMAMAMAMFPPPPPSSLPPSQFVIDAIARMECEMKKQDPLNADIIDSDT